MLFFQNSQFLEELAKLGCLVFFSMFLSSLLMYLSMNLTLLNPDVEKLSTYECGFEPYEDARDLFDVKFYLVAILFLVFDLEAVYFFPWAVEYSCINSQGVWLMFDFILELIIGYIYAWNSGALNWK
jgi:NADH-quinone oxidoreductase subunit A